MQVKWQQQNFSGSCHQDPGEVLPNMGAGTAGISE